MPVVLGSVVEMNPPWAAGHVGRVIAVEPPGPHWLPQLRDVTRYTVDLHVRSKRIAQERWTGPHLNEDDEPYFRVLPEDDVLLLALAGKTMPPPASDELGVPR